MQSMVEGFFNLTVYQARQLRRRMSPSEIRLWRVLKQDPGGVEFRRQHPFGPFVFDSFCRAAALAIEVDGVAHDMGDNPQRDERRDRWTLGRGIETLRIAAEDIRNNFEGVVTVIIDRCLQRTPPPHCVRSPSPSNDGEAGAA